MRALSWQVLVYIKSVILECALQLGYSSVKPEEALKAFIQERKDVFIAVPTGFGKSLCYCLLPLVFDRIREDGKSSIVIVVSPLLALMTDQVNTISKRGLQAGYVSGENDSDSVDMKKKGWAAVVNVL